MPPTAMSSVVITQSGGPGCVVVVVVLGLPATAGVAWDTACCFERAVVDFEAVFATVDVVDDGCTAVVVPFRWAGDRDWTAVTPAAAIVWAGTGDGACGDDGAAEKVGVGRTEVVVEANAAAEASDAR